MALHVKVAVIGGGLAGKAAAVASARAGFATLHIAPAAPPDRRTSALMGPSVDYLRRTGLVPDPAAIGAPLRRIRIIDATGRLLRAPETVFDCSEMGLDAFGWNFANTALNSAFAAAGEAHPDLAVREATLSAATREDPSWALTLDSGETVRAELLVGADGKGSKVRQWAGISVRDRKYAQAALVCDLELGKPLDGESVEFHYPDGPFTLVPAGGNRANLVWIDRPETLEAARQSPEALVRSLAGKSLNAFGTIHLTSPSFVFPLSSLSVETAGKNAMILVGEAGHAFPPIGAQGLNLGLRDIADFDVCLRAANPGAYGWADAAARAYGAMRAPDLTRTGLFVDGLFTSLLSPHLPAQAMRSMGLWGMKLLPGLRKQAMAFGLGK